MLFIIQLSIYHVWLVYHRISTFDHIIYKRELKLKEAELQVSLFTELICSCIGRENNSG